MRDAPDHQRLAAEVLGIRNAPADLARRLVAQALVVEDRQAEWRRVGARIAASAPQAPGVYVLRDEEGRALYVGKAVNLRRRLRAHFAARRWSTVKAAMARAAAADWAIVGSELEALLREAALIAELKPAVNVQVGPPAVETRAIPAALIRDVILVLPSVEEDSVELVAARADGACMIQRTRRGGDDLGVHTSRLMRFFHSPIWRPRGNRVPHASVVVFSWLAGRGRSATRVDPHDVRTRKELAARLLALFADEELFGGRIDQRRR